MKHTLSKTLLLLFVVILCTNCEKKELTSQNELDTSENYTVKSMLINDFLKSNTYESFNREVTNRKKMKLSSKNSESDNVYQFIGREVLSTFVDEQTIYTIAIRNVNGGDENYDLNLLMKENEFSTSTYIVKYPKTGGNIIVQPVNNPKANTTSKSAGSESSNSSCETYLWSVSNPCPCQGHTSAASCSCSSQPSSSSGSVVICYDEPIWVSDTPGSYNPFEGLSEGGSGQSAGGLTTTPNETPIYIYEGEPNCDGNGNCTPPLYWAQAQSWGDPDTFTLDYSLNIEGTEKIDPNEELKCFDLSMGAKLIVYIQQPKENTTKLVGPNEVGHAFIGIEQDGIVRQMGFYPPTGANNAMVAVGVDYTSELRSNYDYLYHVSISRDISSSQLTSIVNYIKNAPETYNVNEYACTDFAINVGNLGGMNLPSTTVNNFTFSGRTPGVLGQEVRARSVNLDPNETISTTRAQSPESQGSCD